MENPDSPEPLPAYSYYPGCPWPHPNRSFDGQPSHVADRRRASPGQEKDWWIARFRRGVELFNAGYYWEAHEVWEDLWHVEGRAGPTAEVLKGLIKFAAAGVKVRERRESGVRTHCRRAAMSFALAAEQGGRHQLGLDLDVWARRCQLLAEHPPRDPGPADATVTRVFDFRVECAYAGPRASPRG
jgi:uncharacterized protein